MIEEHLGSKMKELSTLKKKFIGKKLKSGWDTFIVHDVSIFVTQVDLHCVDENDPKRKWIVVLNGDGSLPSSVEGVVEQ